MKDIAKAAGVSRTAVSFVLNNIPDSNIPEATRNRILQVAHELDYTPNRQALNLASGKTMMIALIVRQTSLQMAIDPFLPEFVHGVTQVIEAADYHLLIHAAEPSAKDKTTYGQLVRTHKVDGLLISSPMAQDSEVRLLHEEGTPIVVHGDSDFSHIPSVDVDNRQGAYNAVCHLLDLGHHRIGYISNAPFSYTSARDRLLGYRQALDDAGIPYDDSLIYEGNFTETSSYLPMQSLLDLPEPPTAVFIGSDLVALGAIDAILNWGLRIPDDISVIGFDDIMFAKYVRPPLSTVHIPAYELGRSAGEMILAIIRGESPTKLRVLLPTELVLRSSTTAARTFER
jgi:LacI family transcriptional regulator